MVGLDERYGWIENKRVIAAVSDQASLIKALKSPVEVIFLLQSDIMNVEKIVSVVKSVNKKIFLHVDFLSGLSSDAKAMEYVAKKVKPSGIISTRPSTIRSASQFGLFAIQRVFILDSRSVKTAIASVESAQPDMVEIMPGIMHSVTANIVKQISVPVIAGGLVSQPEDVKMAIEAGAVAISTGSSELWEN